MRKSRVWFSALLVLALTGCSGGNDFTDLQQYLDEVRARPKGSIEPLPPFVPYEAFIYSASAMRHPFQPPIKVDLAQRQKGTKNIHPDETRVRQFLEGFNIENFVMVGTLSNRDGRYALVLGGGGVHRVKVGDYLGRNHGRIVEISEASVDVVEIVPDGDGGWLERPRSLNLKERT
ncbi:pilus assembly protein PilP [Pseudomonas sp. S5(2021)]|jgi:type IV pilus assembly protein PilP|uniref:pilus assembly protein PilP n=1 Tax=Stutzerimonas balearica TaxID=74829 RepID=UPI0019BD35E7|nr:pilus assembly protein PilP [Stutzerimonas balearica]MBC7198759.1 pilus assembly protein PilP [Stutzerimonas balearica]MBZ5754876.1 pilus assembly protein PilP [Pseudomonas sp. S5(2021)]WAN10307.1 pilus assembly protein PilP [Stutzerimonas balearica]